MEFSVEDSILLAQGAEAKLFKCKYLKKEVVVKERFIKTYRHKDLDERITKERIRSEARAIVRAKAAGVCTPTIYLVDFNRRSICMEYIQNAIVLKSFIEENIPQEKGFEELISLITTGLGQIIAKLHSNYIVHGDLTTSNVLLKNLPDKIDGNCYLKVQENFVMIDFGLAQTEATTEDAAVDLYVLERSLSSGHAKLESLFKLIFESYQKDFKNQAQLKEIIIKYKDVKARGRKRTMVG